MEFMDYLKKNIRKVSILAIVAAIVVSSIIFIVSDTYAFTSYTVVFNRNNNTEVMKTCQTDENGMLDEDCLTTIASICTKWSPYHKYSPEGQIDQVLASDFANMTFTEDKNYYCVGGTSGSYNMGCYVCNTDDTIMHWAASGNANEFCEAGYTKSETILDEASCKVIIPDSCYVCNNDNNIMKWDNNGDADNECSSGYTSTSKPQNECVTIIPDSCYVCNNDNNIMKWDNNGDADNECSSGYTSTSKPQNECVTIIPDSCYVCNNDNNIMKWDNNGNSDNECSSGYTSISKPKNECVTIIPDSCYVCNNDDNIMKWDNNGDADVKCSSGYTKSTTITDEESCKVKNPDTGSLLIAIVWIVGIGALGYTLYYCKNLKVKD